MTDTLWKRATAVGTAVLNLPDGGVELPLLEGTEGERALDIRRLRELTGLVTLDDGYANTGACPSAIGFVDGERGVLRYRGYPVEELAEKETFLATAWLLLEGELPGAAERESFAARVAEHCLLHESLRHHFEGFPSTAHPMAILSAVITAMGCYQQPLVSNGDGEGLTNAAALLISKVRTIAAFSYKHFRGEPLAYPDPAHGYGESLLCMMFSRPNRPYRPTPEMIHALELFLILHAEHEQNCSTSTARMVGSSGANLYAAVSAAVCALWGRLHGGANTAVVHMLEQIRDGGETVGAVIERAKRQEVPLYGFGHRVYKTYDPRVLIFKDACDALLASLGRADPLLDIAKELEHRATTDDYFLERRLYPNLDFYSGLLLRSLGFPLNMFTVLFAIGRLPGWIAHWAEAWRTGARLQRPRQLYVGTPHRPYGRGEA